MAKTNERTARSEREFTLDVNAAVAATEDEIFGEALGQDELDNDGDRSLEEMGEGLEGDHLDEEAEADEEDEAGDGDGGEEEGKDGKEGEAGEADKPGETAAALTPEAEAGQRAADPAQRTPQASQQGEPRRGFVPSDRLRETNERARTAEERATQLERELAEMRGQMSQLTAHVTRPAPATATPERPAKPDMFADPEGYERWVLDEAERRADTRLSERFTAREAEQRAQREEFVNGSLSRASSGERQFEFQAAYGTLTQLDPRNAEHRSLVRGIVDSPDPGKALFDWWDTSGYSQEYREHIAKQLGLETPSREDRGAGRSTERNPDRNPGRSDSRSQPAARHVTRIPDSLRSQPPSLNAARGGARHETADPDMLDGSEDSVFRFATR